MKNCGAASRGSFMFLLFTTEAVEDAEIFVFSTRIYTGFTLIFFATEAQRTQRFFRRDNGIDWIFVSTNYSANNVTAKVSDKLSMQAFTPAKGFV